jgi:hypothetical protein
MLRCKNRAVKGVGGFVANDCKVRAAKSLEIVTAS